MEDFKIENSINHTIVYASILLRRQLFSLFKKYQIDITPEQWVILYFLWQNDGISLGEISQKTQKDNANTTRIVNRMETQGLVKRIIKDDDKRFFYLFLTEKANELKSNVYKSILKSTDICSTGLTDEEQQTFLKLLNKIIDNMENYKK
jgi:DNA-binding MarR family transcriptional regulator